MRLTYGNKLGGIPRTNIPVPEDEKRYNSILNADGTRDELKDWRLYFKKSSDGGILPEYNVFGEKGEFKDGDILYAFKDVRLVPVYDESGQRLKALVGGFELPGRWDLVADLYLYLRRDVVINSQGTSILTETMSGIIQSDVLLANGELEYKIDDCGNGKNFIDWYYKFSVDSIESLPGLDTKQTSITTGEEVDLAERLTSDRPNTMNKLVPLAKRGAVPKGKGVLPESGEYVESNPLKIITWDGFTIDGNQYRINETTNQTEKHTNPITQNIIWQSIWKTWMGWKYDNVSIDPTDVRLDDGSDYYDGALLALEVDGYPLKSDFSDGYYMPRSSKWIRVSKRLDDSGFINICRGKTNCGKKLPSDDCTKKPFTLVDVKRRIDLDKYVFISKDTSNFLPIPGNPCYQGLAASYDVTSYYEYTSSKECFDGRVDDKGNVYGSRIIQYQSYITSSTNRVIEWENIIRNTINPMCECYELSVQNPPCIDSNDTNGCNVLHTDTIYTICPDDGTYYYQNRIVPPNAFPTRLVIRHIDKENCKDLNSHLIYHPIKFDKDLLNAESISLTNGTFENTASLFEFYTSSIQSINSKKYYLDVVGTDADSSDVYFSLIYGDKNGSGSLVIGERTSDTPSKSNYFQYKLMLQDYVSSSFEFYTSGSLDTTIKDVYIINFNNTLLKDKLDVGNFQMSLSDINNSANVVTLIDNSDDITNSKYFRYSPYHSFHLVSGSLTDGKSSMGSGTPDTNNLFTNYGVLYPNLGIIVLDPNKLNTELNFNTISGSNVYARNEIKLFTSISGAMAAGYPIISRSGTDTTSTHYFIRVPADAATYSNNPTYFNKTDGSLKNKRFAINPITYITTIGLYNNSEELLAVAKLSRPIKKTMENDVLIDIKLPI
jgi:hypothetical protein